MAETAIEWATHVWNPVTGCDRALADELDRDEHYRPKPPPTENQPHDVLIAALDLAWTPDTYHWFVRSDCGVVKVWSSRDGCMVALSPRPRSPPRPAVRRGDGRRGRGDRAREPRRAEDARGGPRWPLSRSPIPPKERCLMDDFTMEIRLCDDAGIGVS